MSGTLNDALALIKNTIVGSSAINNHCTTNYSKKPKVFIGFDPHSPPDLKSNVPLIWINPGTRQRLSDATYILHQIEIGIAIECKTRTVSGDVTELDGLDKINSLAVIVEKEISKALGSNGFPHFLESGEPDSAAIPYFMAHWVYMIRCVSRI